jgi:hypothetical protein
MYPNVLNRSNPTNKRFITAFNKPSMTTSSTGKATHQGSYSKNITWELHTMDTISSYGGMIDPEGNQWPPTYSTSSK